MKRLIHAPAASPHGSVASYTVTFLLCILFSVDACILVERRPWHYGVLIAVISLLAVVQFVLQTMYFLHLGISRSQRWRTLLFVFMLGTVVTVVAGSLWIMANLNYHMTMPQTEQYLHNSDSL